MKIFENLDINDYYIYIYLDPKKFGKYKYGEYEFEYEPFYVGKGKNKRYKNIVGGRNEDFINIINEIEKFGFEPIVVKLFKNLSEKQSFEIEEKLILEIGRIDLNTGSLINKTSGGQGSSGLKHSEEELKKRRKNFSDIKKEFESRECELLTQENEYKNSHDTKLRYRCKKDDNEYSITWGNFQQGHGCPYCKNKLLSENKKGENNPNYKITSQKRNNIELDINKNIYTQEEMAKKHNVSTATISRIKNKTCRSKKYK